MSESESFVETMRTRLRTWSVGDAPALVAMNAGPDVMRYVDQDRADTLDAAVRWIEGQQRHWDEHGYGICAVEGRRSGRFIGFVGLATPAPLPEAAPATGIGWRIRRELWGRGLATEAAAAVLAVAHDRLRLREVLAVSDPENAASIRVMQKAGMKFSHASAMPGTGGRALVYSSRPMRGNRGDEASGSGRRPRRLAAVRWKSGAAAPLTAPGAR